MSVGEVEVMAVIPFARAERIVPQITPTHYGYGLVTMSGDSSGGTATANLTLPGGFFFRVEAISMFSSDSAADTGSVFMSVAVDWIEDTLPVLNVLFETAMPMTAHIATRSHADPRYMAAFVEQLRRIPLGRLSGAATSDGIRGRFENNVNLQSYTLEVFASAWEKPSFGLPGFLDQLILS
jgi:hypothetical protein